MTNPISKVEENCKCACHENKLNKPYAHDQECCEKMNGYLVDDQSVSSYRQELIDWAEGEKVSNPVPNYGRDDAPITKQDLVKMGVYERLRGFNSAFDRLIDKLKKG